MGGKIARLAAPETAALDDARGALIPTAEGRGFNLTPAMRTGDPGLLTKESALAKTTIGAPRFHAVNRENSEALNLQLSQAAGAPSKQITPQVLDDIKADVSKLYNVADGKNIYVEPATQAHINNLFTANPDAARILQRTNDTAYQGITSGTLSGKDYVQVRKQLVDLKARALNSNIDAYPLAEAYQEVTNALDKAADATAHLPAAGGVVPNPLRDADIKTLQTARERHKALQVLKDTTGGSFDVDPNKLGKSIEGWYRSTDPTAQLSTEVANIPGLKESIKAGSPGNVSKQKLPERQSLVDRATTYGGGFTLPAMLGYAAGGPAGGAVGTGAAMLGNLLLRGRGFAAPAYLKYGAEYYQASPFRQALARALLQRPVQGYPISQMAVQTNQGDE